VWILPVGLIAFYGLMFILGLLSEDQRMYNLTLSSGQWTLDIASVWKAVSTFPGNVFGNLLPLSFVAVSFAGEYQWGTWKNILPGNLRAGVIGAKFVTVIATLMLSLVVSSLLNGICLTVIHKIAATSYPPQITAKALGDFVIIYFQQATLALVTLLIVGLFASLAAILTRSILGGLLLGFLLTVAESVVELFLVLFSNMFKLSGVVNLYQYAPSYNIGNLRSWFETGTALTNVVPGFSAEPNIAVSSLILVVWILVLFGLMVFIFQRQDITS
jgi:hypothetical protein